MKTTILWDHDGVLVDTEPWYFEATRSVIASLGVELVKEDYLRDMALGRSAWERADAPPDVIDSHKAKRNLLYQQFLQEQDIEIAGVTEVLAELAQSYEMAIVTTAKKADFELIHRDRDIVPNMQFVLANGDYERSKPHPDPYLTALNRFGTHKAQAVVVEDSERGLRAAIAAGIDCIVVANEFVKGQDLSGATWHVQDLGEIPELLASL